MFNADASADMGTNRGDPGAARNDDGVSQVSDAVALSRLCVDYRFRKSIVDVNGSAPTFGTTRR